MVGLIVMAVLIVIGVVVFAMDHLSYRKVGSGQSKTELNTSYRSLSLVAKQVYNEYMELPEDSRPIPDIMSVLAGLDAATGPDEAARRKRSDHFDYNSYMRNKYGSYGQGVVFTWNGPEYGYHCDHSVDGYHACPYGAYYALHKQIKATKKQIEQKNAALALSANGHHVEMALEVAERLRNEAEIQRQVRHEIAGTTEPKHFDRWGSELY